MRRRPVTLRQNYTLVQRLLSDEKKAHKATQRLLRATMCNNADLHIENAKMTRELAALRITERCSIGADELTPAEILENAA